jgi:hypothetical protein
MKGRPINIGNDKVLLMLRTPKVTFGRQPSMMMTA